MNINSLLISDAYKQSHRIQYPEGTTLVYSNWTPRSDRHSVTKGGVVVFGIQAFLKKITKEFNDNFFSMPHDIVVDSYKQGYLEYFGTETDAQHVKDLHDLGYLPICVKALPEGSICPIGVPMLTIWNSIPKFFWITNFLETIMSTELWLPMTSATIAKEYNNILMGWATWTCDNYDHIPFQAHDFSMRGMSGLESASASGAGHLLSSSGSDTIPAVYYLKEYYHADASKELIGVSIPATEHSVMSMGTQTDELGTFRRLITETYPNGLLSIVSDTWDLWKVLTEYVPALKNEIMARDGKIVIRPDSGNPVDIICGDSHAEYGTPQSKGVIELLWDIFGGTVNDKTYRVLDEHIGAIYGDAITLARADEILRRLEIKGFASSNIVFGVGSYTYQYNTRDTYGFAMKATYGEVNHNGRAIYKNPVTDLGGAKKSLKGLIRVELENGKYVAHDECSWVTENTGELIEVYANGKFEKEYTLSEIRERLNG
jgi:nicotinamide phosphoribosyltransferase